MNTNRYHAVILYFLLILALAVALTWPLPLHLATHAPGDGSDDPAILWNLWWVRYSLTELQQSPFESAWMFWPLGINLVFYTLTTLNGLLSIPIQLALGIVPANSFVIYFELTIAALGMWLFVRWLLMQHLDVAPRSQRTRDAVALLAAVVYAFSASKWLYLSLGQFNIASSHWLPWSLLYLGRMWFARTWRQGAREAALCALFTLFSGWTEFTYASFFIQLAFVFWLWHIVVADLRHGQWAKALRYTGFCALLGALFLLGMAPILVLMVQDMRTSGDFLVEGLGFANVFSNDLLGFLVPGDQHPLFGAWVAGFDFAYLNFAFLGWVTALLALVALLAPETRRYAVSWAAMGSVFVLLSLGPTLRLNGREWELPMPFDLMLQLPLLKANRYPSRYSVLIALCMAVLVAWGVVALLKVLEQRSRADRYRRASLLLVFALLPLLLFEHWGAPLPLSDYRVPEVYEQLKGREGTALLELPLAWRNGFRVTGVLHNSFMFAQAFQTTHEKRLLSGNTSRNPEFKFQYFTELPVINSLLALERGLPLPPGRAEQDAAIAPELLRLLDAPNIVVRRISQEAPPVHPEAALAYLEEILPLARWHESEGYVGLEATLPPAPEQVAWDTNHPLAHLFFAEGWSALPPLDNPEGWDNVSLYAEQETAHLLLPSIASPGAWRLRFKASVPSGLETPVTISAADPAGGPSLLLATLTLRGEEEYEVLIPPEGPRGPLTELTFHFGARHPAELFSETSILVESAEEGTGNLAHIYVNGVDVAGRGTGYHAARLSAGGEVLATGYFNTFSDPNASATLAAFINESEPGQLIALAASDTVSGGEGSGGTGLMLSDEVFAALEALGTSPASDMRGRFRWSHAFIGIKGARSALEDSSPIRPARVVFGQPLHSPLVAAGFDGFTLEPAE